MPMDSEPRAGLQVRAFSRWQSTKEVPSTQTPLASLDRWVVQVNAIPSPSRFDTELLARIVRHTLPLNDDLNRRLSVW